MKSKNALMVVATSDIGYINIGDYIQAIAARQYFSNIDYIVDRDHDLDKFNGDPSKIIMNGWFMDHPENFPPSEKLKPLFVAFHINKYGLPKLLEQKCINYYKKHEPIGCRDLYTTELLQKKGIKSFFSGCLTLTLGKTYRYEGKERSGIYIVDPYFSTQNLSKKPLFLAKALYSLLLNYKNIKCITKKKGDITFKNLLHNAVFYMQYNKVFAKEVLTNAEYINQYNNKLPHEYPTYKERLDYAEVLIRKYARAQLIITSRIHCALPSTGLESPVIFINDVNADKMSTDRFGGIKELFNIIDYDKDHLIWNGKKISTTSLPPIKQNWRQLAEKLTIYCQNFVTNN